MQTKISVRGKLQIETKGKDMQTQKTIVSKTEPS